jgi:hypothetical protein
MTRSYFSESIPVFLTMCDAEILGRLTSAQGDIDAQQVNAWREEIRILRSELAAIDGHLCLEFSIPRMGKRIDVVVLYKGIVFPVEFKVFATDYAGFALDQVMDYALDLKNFHEQSHEKTIVPILVSTEAADVENHLSHDADNVFAPVKTNAHTLGRVIQEIGTRVSVVTADIDASAWENSIYKPTPTIIEAAQALYNGHTVAEISRSDAGAINLSRTAEAIFRIIALSREARQKTICFVTGVPGAGKTLAGLNIATQLHDPANDEHAVFLSGNGPLVKVLREALVRNKREAASGASVLSRRATAEREVGSFIQNVHNFRDDALATTTPPVEHVAIFDEAQRAWTLGQTAKFMKQKKNCPDFNMSEPEFLISCMDRHEDWTTIICLIGGGQEINTGEAGLPEWFAAIKHRYPHWHIYLSPNLNDTEYTRGQPLSQSEDFAHLHAAEPDLHLSVSIRSFRSEKLAGFVKALLDQDISEAFRLHAELRDVYPIVITRDLNMAKQWLRCKARGSERYGIITSSDAMRLRPYGINLKAGIDTVNWFLNCKDDVRSSYFLEDVATEFDVQGLELDWTCVAWDADFHHGVQDWEYMSFRGTQWTRMNDADRRLYRKNAYRVLLTRARQGMVLFIPHGSNDDTTRLTSFYDGTYNYLRDIGLQELV